MSTIQKILMIDDDVDLCDLIRELLSAEGLDLRAAHNGEEGVRRALTEDNALIILDVMLPGIGGFEVLRRIRSQAATPILMLTARGDDVDRILGLEIGADDYLSKPFNPRELIARIRAILRRSQATPVADKQAQRTLSVGDLHVDTGARVVRRSGKQVELTAAEFELLVTLMDSAGRIVARDDLAKAALGRKLAAYDRSIDMHVSNLRKKLGHRIGEIERIKTVRGVGYIYANPEAGEEA